MAAIENDNPVRKPNRQRRFNKKSTRVDLTPMVDLGFLLITFFVFTTQLSQPTVMNLNMPNDTTKADDPVCESCALTVFLQADNLIEYYEGMPVQGAVLRQTSFAPDGIRTIILNKKKAVQKARGDASQLILIIKSSDKSTFQNFVDMLDEVAIGGVKRYYLDEVNADEKRLFFSNRPVL